MLRVDLTQAKPGMKLALPVNNPKALTRTLLKAGYELTEEAIKRVDEMGVRSIWVAYPSLSAVEKYLSMDALKVQQDVVTKIADTFEETQGKAAAKLDYEVYSTSVKSMVAHVATNPKTAVFIGELSDSDDDLMRHASTVTYLSVLMGLKLESYMVRQRKHVNPARAKEITNLGVGAMLHDFGMTLLPEDVRDRFFLENDESDPEYREHTALGFRAVRGQIDPSAATVVLHHHQRFDGSGFAGADFQVQNGESIHIYARIAAVADQFDRMRRPMNLPEQPTVAVLNAMLSPTMRKRFDPHVLMALIEVVPPYAPGSQLRLSDGRAAVCVDHNVAEPCRPVVKTIAGLDPGGDKANDSEDDDGETINLAEMPLSLYVAECDGHPVAEFNFTLETIKNAA
ncbi:MAG: HD domain-containing phosphohydrolase [Planctomycetota bacterium]